MSDHVVQRIDTTDHWMFFCPFCKGKPEISFGAVIGEKVQGERVYEAVVECTKCGASSSTEKGIKYAAILAAVGKWNSRATDYYRITQLLGFPVVISDLVPENQVILAHAEEAEHILLRLRRKKEAR